MLRILICGDRNWTDLKSIKVALLSLQVYWGDKLVVIEGEAKGADTLGKQAARDLNIPEEDILKFPADWEKYGKAAGPIRNQQMLDEGKPDIVLAFHPDIGSSKGTLDMVKRANKAGIPVRLFAK
jgi:hypothetical protein